MARYLAELYLPKSGSGSLREAAARARSAAEELTREGRPVRYVRALFLGEDETCFHLYEAASVESVREAARRAAIPVERIVEAVEIAPGRARRPAERSNPVDFPVSSRPRGSYGGDS